MTDPASPKPLRFSPSAITTYRDECPRKWAFRALHGIETPQNVSAALGTATHAQLEAYEKGQPIDFTTPAGYLAASATHLLPAPQTPGVETEKYFKFVSPKGHQYHGYTDLIGPDVMVFPDLPKEAVPGPFVSDHKTTSNIDLYAKKSNDLHTDPQGVIYAKEMFNRFPDAEEGNLIWTYIKTRGAKEAKRVHLPVIKRDVERQFHIIELTADEMAVIHNNKTAALELPPSLGHCDKYGGCPFHPSKGAAGGRGCTDLSTRRRGGPVQMTQAVEDMLRDLGARAGVTVPSSESMPDWLTALVDPGPGTSVPVFGENVDVSAHPPVASESVVVPSRTTILPPAINPPGEAAPESAALLPPPEPVAEKPAKRGRPKKQATTPAEDTTYTREAPTIPAPPSAPPAAPAAAASVVPEVLPQQAIKTLYVDCVPDGGLMLRSAVLFSRAAERLKREGDVDDYRLVDFGKGAPLFIDAVRQELAAVGTPWDVFVDSHTPEGMLCLNALVAMSASVVRGLR